MSTSTAFSTAFRTALAVACAVPLLACGTSSQVAGPGSDTSETTRTGDASAEVLLPAEIPGFEIAEDFVAR